MMNLLKHMSKCNNSDKLSATAELIMLVALHGKGWRAISMLSPISTLILYRCCR